MTYTPKKSKKSQYLSMLFIISGFLAMAVSGFMPNRVIIQVVSLVLVVVGVQLIVRFSLTDYRYIIDDRDDGSSDLIVCRRQGKKDVKVCHLSLSLASDVYRRGEKKTMADARYNYVQNPAGDETSVIFLDGEKLLEVIIECDDRFADAIRCRAGIGGGEMRFVM